MHELPRGDLSQFRNELRQDALCDRFDSLWSGGQRPCLSEFLKEVSEHQRAELFRELLGIELEYKCRGREQFTANEYLAQFPCYQSQIVTAFANLGDWPESGSS
jgi:hypothetical protein